MKCQVTSNTTHGILISKAIGYDSYKEICKEPKKVKLGHFGNRDWGRFRVENNSLVQFPRDLSEEYIEFSVHGTFSTLSSDSEVISKFLSNHNIEQNWLHCNYSYGYYDEELGGWTGCVGKV